MSYQLSHISTKKINTPMKASVVLMTAVILSSCSSDFDNNLFDAAFNSSQTVSADTDTDPETTDPETTDPETTDPETTDPETTDPETTDPETTDPETNDPETTDPIPNQPKAMASGVQSLNIDVIPLNRVFNATTRDFDITADGVVARADLASETAPGAGDGLLGVVPVTTSGANDTEIANGYMVHEDSATVGALGQQLPLTYTSIYKDFSDDLRVGHIDGSAVFSGIVLPVDGVAAIGNATKAENMPTAGAVQYEGDATYRQLGIDKTLEYGKSVFNADFVAQTVVGDLTFENVDDINLQAAISGNQISGTTSGYLTEGGFYGGDAQYLGGVYAGNNAQGTYGAGIVLTAEQAAADQASADQAAADQAAADQAAADQAAADQAAADQAAADQAAADQAAADQAAADQAAADQAAADQAAADQVAADQAATEPTPNQPEDNASGVQSLNIDVVPLNQVFNTTTRDFDIIETGVIARADLASESAPGANDGLLGVVPVTTSSANDTEIADGYMAHEDAATVSALGQELPLTYTSIYKDFSDDLRVGHIDGSAVFSGIVLPVNGVAALGNATMVENMPTDGTAEYVGDATYRQLGIDKTLEYGGSAFTADFAAQTVAGELNFDNVDDINLQASISGNQFSGTTDGYLTEGGFYGGDAQYLGGIYTGNGAQGTYGAGLAAINDEQATAEQAAAEQAAAEQAAAEQAAAEQAAAEQAAAEQAAAEQAAAEQAAAEQAAAEQAAAEQAAAEQAAAEQAAAEQAAAEQAAAEQAAAEQAAADQAAAQAAAEEAAAALKEAADASSADTELTGFQSTALSSVQKSVPFAQLELLDAIGYVEIRDDQSDFTDTETKNGAVVPVDNRQGDNFTSYSTGVVRGDMVQPASIQEPLAVSLTEDGSVTVEAGKGDLNPDFNYKSVYENFDQQMQIGHVYGVINSRFVGDLSRIANVYVEGNATSQADLDYLESINDGKAEYVGVATYIENIHLGSEGTFAPINGTSNFNVDFVNDTVDGTLSFDTVNDIGISATIDGSTFAGNANGIDTAGGFYGENAQFLGGIYQEALVEGGAGTTPGTGTTFQGTYGAEMQ